METRVKVQVVKGSYQVAVPAPMARSLGLTKGSTMSVRPEGRGVLLEKVDDERPTLFTIGYEGHTPDSFVAALSKAGVRQLLDIRDLPLSRRRGFSKTPLREALADVGILYEHIRDLGAPEEVRKPYLEGGTRSAFRSAYLAHVDKHRAAVDGVKWHISQAPTAVMCVESHEAACHRGLLAELLAAQGYRIQHL